MEGPKTRRRSLALAGAALFAAASTLYGGLWIYAARRQPTAYLGVEFGSLESNVAMRLRGVRPGGPADRAGLRPHDRIVAVDGQPLTTLLPFAAAVLNGRPGDRVRLTVQRPGEPNPLLAEIVLDRPPPSQQTLGRRLAGELVNSYPALFLVVSVTVLLLHFKDKNAWRLALLFNAFIAMAPALEPGIPDAFRGFSVAFKLAFDGSSAALFLYFFSVFPAPSPLDRRLPWLKWLWLATGVGTSVPLAAWAFREGSLTPLIAWLGRLELPVLGPIRFYYFAGFGLGLASLLANALRGSTDVQRKSRVIFWGMLVGFGPALLLFAAAVDAGKAPYEFPFWIWAPCVLALSLIPLSFAYAVVRHRVLEIPVLLRRSARYLLVQRGSLGLLMLLGAVAVLGFSYSFGRVVGPQAQTAGVGLGLGFGTVLVWTGSQVQRRLRQRVDRAFFRSAYDARQLLEDLAQRIPSVTSRGDLATLLESHLGTALLPQALTVYLESGAGSLARLRGPGPDTLSPTLPILVEVARRGQPRELLQAEGTGLAPLAPDCLVPVLGRDGRLAGLVVLATRLSEEPYSGEDKRLLASVASQAGMSLESLRLAELMAQRVEVERRAAHEMELAKAVQAKLLPQQPPVLATLECAGRCIQARAVGGDYFDFLELGPGRVGLVLADISGKGFPAALLMASLQASVRSRSAEDFLDLPRQMSAVNQLLYQTSDTNRFATLFLGLYDDQRRRLIYANCGHNPPFLLRGGGGFERLDPTGPALGLLEKWQCTADERKLEPGDLLAIFSDGITEAFSNTG